MQVVTSMREMNMQQLLRVHKESICEDCVVSSYVTSRSVMELRAEQDFYDYLRDFFHNCKGIYALWVVDGRYCAALRLERYDDGLLLSGLETAPDARGKGYATSLVQAVLEYLTQTDYQRVYSHVRKNNMQSLQIHNTCGFQRILEHAVYIDGSVYHSSCTFCYEL